MRCTWKLFSQKSSGKRFILKKLVWPVDLYKSDQAWPSLFQTSLGSVKAYRETDSGIYYGLNLIDCIRSLA